ncbi:hypothetical protein N1851_006724 [Merluccius polli]|uniref:Uncharacterized protein n=1 Tax=Merluccius polli TaxID=89951 RepID=A0AA47N569_MERPO|nr:hypothetical protein N1851_006724 [Merluccius polli]
MARTNGPGTPYSLSIPHRIPEGHDRKPSPGPQNTCRLDRQSPTPPQQPCKVKELVLSLSQALLSLPESPNSLPKVLLHSLPELLPHPDFCFSDCRSCSPSSLPVSVCCLGGPLGQPIPKGLLQLDGFLSTNGFPPRQAPITFRPQLLAAASAMEVLNMTHSDSMSPTSPGMCEKFFRRWDLMDRGSHQTFPVHPHYTFGFTRSFQQPPPSSDPTHHQVVIS